MSAYLMTFIYGNESFGGYFSVDGESSRPIEDDMTYQLDPGPHLIEIFSTSNFERKTGAFQASLYRNTSSSGAILDAIERRQALKNLGDSWSIEVFVEEGQAVVLNVRSSGNSIVGDPVYSIEDLSDEQIESLEEVFEELEREYQEELNRPKRKPAKIVWGIILMFCSLVGIMNFSQADPQEYADAPWAPWVVVLGLLAGGLLLFINGIRKKVRN